MKLLIFPSQSENQKTEDQNWRGKRDWITYRGMVSTTMEDVFKKDTAIRIYLPGIMKPIEPFRLSAAHAEAPQGSKTSWAVKKAGTGLTTGLRSPHEEGE